MVKHGCLQDYNWWIFHIVTIIALNINDKSSKLKARLISNEICFSWNSSADRGLSTYPKLQSRLQFTEMPWTTMDEFNVIPKTQQPNLMSHPGCQNFLEFTKKSILGEFNRIISVTFHPIDWAIVKFTPLVEPMLHFILLVEPLHYILPHWLCQCYISSHWLSQCWSLFSTNHCHKCRFVDLMSHDIWIFCTILSGLEQIFQQKEAVVIPGMVIRPLRTWKHVFSAEKKVISFVHLFVASLGYIIGYHCGLWHSQKGHRVDVLWEWEGQIWMIVQFTLFCSKKVM